MRWTLLACAAFVATAAMGGQVALTVEWAGVGDGRAFPVTGGLPVPRGALRDATTLRLTAGGRAVPLQAQVLAWWPDRSVKWVLLDFQARPATQRWVLDYGATTPRPPPAAQIAAAERDGAVTLDTGALAVTVRRDGCGFIDALAFRGKQVFASAGKRLNFMDFLCAPTAGDAPPMSRIVDGGRPDPSRVAVDAVTLETRGPLRAVVRIDGRYRYRLVGSTIAGTEVKGDCPFRVRITAYAGQSFLKVEHYFVYEGDGDHDLVRSLGLKVGVPPDGPTTVRYLGEKTVEPGLPTSGLYQQTADAFVVWESKGRAARVAARGRRFDGVLDAIGGGMGIAVGVKGFWQQAAKSLHADMTANEVTINLWPPEAPPLDFRRHAREWSVGETGTPDDPNGTTPAPFKRSNYRLASKGVGKTHYALVYCHPPDESTEAIRNVYRLFNHRPLLWASPRHYARSRALGRYREPVKGEHDEVEAVIASGIEVWKAARESHRWYGFWLYGNVCQDYNGFFQHGRWCREFGRWGWANGDSKGRLTYALMLQAVRRCTRGDFEFGESIIAHIHDVCCTHTTAYPHHNGTTFRNIAGAAHRHGAWPWACPYVGIRGAHPVGAKIYYFLTGEGHAKDILDELTRLAVRFPNGGEGDGPLGPNAQIFLYQWETTGDDAWRKRLKAELDTSDLLRKADSGWDCMMAAAFGILNALEEYIDLTGDESMRPLAASFADRCMPAKMKRHWTWGGYFRVYAPAHNFTHDIQYRAAVEEMLGVLCSKVRGSLAFRVPREHWPGPPGGPQPFIDANIIRDVPFALHSLHLDEEGKR